MAEHTKSLASSIQIGDEDEQLLLKKPLTAFGAVKKWLSIAGPGLVVMLADTDAGCLITAGQTGMQWGYSCVLLQFILIPIIFIAQELTIRLAIFTRQGQAELVKTHFGKFWAWFVALCILVTCAGGVCSEISGVMGVGTLFNVPKPASVAIMVVFLMGVVVTGSYRRVERIALFIGMFELVYLGTMIMSAPKPSSFFKNIVDIPLSKPKYFYIVSANIGAVVMPWMIYYQQSAICDKGLTSADLPYERVDTAIGACLTQLIMTSVIITAAAALWDGSLPSDNSLDNVEEFANALKKHMGEAAGKILFCLGMLGGSLIGAIVVSLTAAWTLGEVVGLKRSLESNPREAPWFYGVYAGILIVGSVIVLSGVNVVNLNVGIQVMNALFLPIVLTFLVILARKTLPEDYKLKGTYFCVVVILFAGCAGLSVFSSIYGIFSP